MSLTFMFGVCIRIEDHVAKMGKRPTSFRRRSLTPLRVCSMHLTHKKKKEKAEKRYIAANITGTSMCLVSCVKYTLTLSSFSPKEHTDRRSSSSFLKRATQQPIRALEAK